jgi:hypothetical protein
MTVEQRLKNYSHLVGLQIILRRISHELQTEEAINICAAFNQKVSTSCLLLSSEDQHREEFESLVNYWESSIQMLQNKHAEVQPIVDYIQVGFKLGWSTLLND